MARRKAADAAAQPESVPVLEPDAPQFLADAEPEPVAEPEEVSEPDGPTGEAPEPELETEPELEAEPELEGAPEPDAGAAPDPEPELVELADLEWARPVLHSRRSFTGRVWDVTTDMVNLGASGVVTRDYVHHPGAVAIIAMNDNREIYLVRQYRHPVRTETWEPPAGMLDVRGEDPLEAARRELHEEADLTAERWDVLVDFFSSPGGSSEGIRIYLARDLAEVPADDRFERQAEEADMRGQWVNLPSVLAAIARGDVAGPTLVIGAFALDAALRSDGATLRPVGAPWRRPPARGEF